MKKILFSTLSLCILFACTEETKKTQTKLKGAVFGTTYAISYLNSTNYKKSIDSLFFNINNSLSTYLPTSDISKINNGDTTVVIDRLFTEVFQKSKRIHKQTNGYFDPTVCELVNAWGFGYKQQQQDLDSTQVATLMQTVGFQNIKLRNGRIIKKHSNTCLDFNSIAKGYGIDVIGRFLEQKNINNYLIEIGGEIRARGKNNKNNYWTIAIDNPNTDGSRSYSKTITLKNASIAGSGNYRKFRISKTGKKIVHTINPKTGFASESNLLSATVYAATDCADVDAYATAFMAMGLEKAKEFLSKNPHIKAVLTYANEKGEITQIEVK